MFSTFLKGIHLTLDGWRRNRDDDGWKDVTRHVASKYNDLTEDHIQDAHEYPDVVSPVPCLIDDLKALVELTESDTALVLLVQSNRLYIIQYRFADASGGGFGSSVFTPNGLEVIHGTWNKDGKDKSSNFRELANLVLRLEKDAEEGKLDGVEMFFFTDNSTTESAFPNGTSSSKLLFDLVLRVKKIELIHSVRLHIIHASGARMIQQGTDSLSRGNFLEGVMKGDSMLKFIPISQSAVS